MKHGYYFIPVFLLLFFGSYYEILSWLTIRYTSTESYYSHGFLIPFVTIFLIWQKRHLLTNKTIKTSWLGFIVFIFAILLHIFGTVVYVFSISGLSILFLAIGCCLFLYGTSVFKIISFPILYIIFMIPLPLVAINTISFPLKILVAKLAVEFIRIFSIPIYQEGFNIYIPEGILLVGNPCSGLRSTISLLAIGALFSHLSKLTYPKKWVLFFLTIPIAILANLIRVTFLIFVSYKWGIASATPDTLIHVASGIIVFILCLTLLYIAIFFLETRENCDTKI